MEFNHDFQSDSTKSGKEFENLVYLDLLNRNFAEVRKNVYIEGTGCEVDFVAYRNDGAIEHVESKGGKESDGKRPGAKRTDNVKKAIANGSLIKLLYPEYIYVVYFSSKPVINSYSDQMLRLALKYKIINEIRYIDINDIEDNEQLALPMDI